MGFGVLILAHGTLILLTHVGSFALATKYLCHVQDLDGKALSLLFPFRECGIFHSSTAISDTIHQVLGPVFILQG